MTYRLDSRLARDRVNRLAQKPLYASNNLFVLLSRRDDSIWVSAAQIDPDLI
jgi:hypothetical protein